MNDLFEDYADFALRFGLGPSEVIALPALFERAAQEVGQTQQGLIEATRTNHGLGVYLASLASTVSATYRVMEAQ